MSVRSWFRNLFATPARTDDGGDPETDADLAEELGAPDEGREDIERMAGTGGGPGVVPGGTYIPGGRFAATEAAETAEADLESEEAPPDHGP